MVVSDRGQQLAHVLIVQAVVGVAAVAPHGDETALAEQPQLLRGGARGEPGQLDELLDGALAAKHRPEQAQATRGAEGTHRLRQRFGLVAL